MKYFLVLLCFFIIGCNSLPEYRFIKEYSQLNYGFTEIYKNNTNEYGQPIGMRLEISGFINGKGMLYIREPPKGYAMAFKLEGKIMKKIDRTDWYQPECLIQFVPDNEFVTGNILIKLRIY